MPGIVQQVGSNPFCIPLIIYIYIHGIYTGSTIYIYRSKTTHHWDAHPNIQHSTCFIFLFSNLWQVLSDLPSGQTLTMRLLDTGAISLPLPPSLSLSPSLQPNIFVLRRRWFTYFTQWYRVVLSRDFPMIPQCSMFASDALFHFRRQHSKLMHNPHICHACCLVLI